MKGVSSFSAWLIVPGVLDNNVNILFIIHAASTQKGGWSYLELENDLFSGQPCTGMWQSKRWLDVNHKTYWIALAPG